MTERLLQFIWQFQYFDAHQLVATTGEPLEVVHPGTFNRHQGPDFLNAQIRVGNTLWAGHVELHVYASGWQQHGHGGDQHYRNVVLHVVWQEDKLLSEGLYTLALHQRVSEALLHRYQQLMQATQFVPCQNSLHLIKPLVWTAWKERLLAERLQQKAAKIEQGLVETNHHWEAIFWWLLARHFGSVVNGGAFEQVARTIPVTLLAKTKGQLLQVEALLLGQAGLLEGDFAEEYPQLLAREYRFLQHKHRLLPAFAQVNFLRMRPANFPTVRLAQLAMLVHRSQHLFTQIRDSEEVRDVAAMLNVTASEYWNHHYVCGEPGSYQPKKVGVQMVNSLLVNTVVPMVYAYGAWHGQHRYTEKACGWLEQLSAEKNTITKGFEESGIGNKHAADSQALIQLKNEYCNRQRCLDCAVGAQLLKEGGVLQA
jgi:hypothetical protein